MALDVDNKVKANIEPYELESIKSVLHSSPVPSIVIVPEGNKFRITAVNSAFLQLTSYTAEDFLDKNVADLFRPLHYASFQNKYALISALQNVLNTTVPSSLEIFRPELLISTTEGPSGDFINCEFYPVHGNDKSVQFLVMQLGEIKRDLPAVGKLRSDALPAISKMEDPNVKSELETLKDKYDDLFNLSPLPQFFYDLDTLDFLDANEAAVEEYGYSKAEFLTMNLMDIRPEEDRKLLTDIINNRVVKGHLGNSTVRHMKRNGEIMHVNVQGNSVRYGGKNARLVVVVNLTEKINARKALERSEQRFKALAQEGSDLIAIISTEGVYHYVNPNSKAIIGVPSDFYIGRNAFEFIHDDDKAMVAEHINLLMHHKRIQLPPFRFEVNNGEYRWIETVMTNMIDDHSICGIIANSRDVTERIKNDIKVQESIERFNVVSKATSDAVWDWDMRDDKLIWNKGITGIFGYKVSETEDSWWQERIHKEDVAYVLHSFQSTIKNKKSRLEVEYRFRCRDGYYKNVLDRMFITYNDCGEPVRMIGSMQDITDRTKYTKEIQAQNKRLQEISWLQSHGVRAPLARVMGLTQLLSSTALEEGSSDECLRYLLQSATELDTIIRDIIRKTEGLQNKK